MIIFKIRPIKLLSSTYIGMYFLNNIYLQRNESENKNIKIKLSKNAFVFLS